MVSSYNFVFTLFNFLQAGLALSVPVHVPRVTGAPSVATGVAVELVPLVTLQQVPVCARLASMVNTAPRVSLAVSMSRFFYFSRDYEVIYQVFQ